MKPKTSNASFSEPQVRQPPSNRFTRLMKEAGNECVLVPFEGKDHGFFNGSFFRKGNGDADYEVTMQRSIEFLKAHGILK